MSTQIHFADEIYEHGFHIIDNFLDMDHYYALRDIIQTMQHANCFKQAKIGSKKKLDANIRGDQIFWLDKDHPNPAIQKYFNEINHLSNTLNQSLFLGLIDYEAHFAIYPPHSFYKKHVDQFATKQDRRISCVYYLNENWQNEFGGELKLYDKADRSLAQIQPLGNRFVCFSSDIPHEVCTAYQTRYSIATWLKVRPM